MTMRKWVCYNSETKLDITKKIVELYPYKKWILFNKSIKSAETLAKMLGPKAVVYHSKLKTNERQKILEDFSNNVYSIVVAVDALTAGLNVPDVDAAICLAGVSTELVATQQLGRSIRYRPDKTAIFINLYSTGTIEEHWVKTKNKNFDHVYWVNDLKHLQKQWLATA